MTEEEAMTRYIIFGWEKRGTLKKLIKRQHGACALCGMELALREADLDHIVPRSMGGPNLYWNFRATHRRCNRERGAAIYDTVAEAKALARFRVYLAEGCKP